jgi:putative redox protein
MASAPVPRIVGVERTSPGRFTATNERGGRVAFGTGDGADFTPTELFLAAVGGCTAIDVDILTSRRAEPEAFAVAVEATKIRDDDGNRLTDIVVTFRVRFSDGTDGDAARGVLPGAVQRSHDRLCTVGRTVELATPIATRIE